MRTITEHYIDGAFVESHGREVMDSIGPTTSQVVGRVGLGDAEDAARHRRGQTRVSQFLEDDEGRAPAGSASPARSGRRARRVASHLRRPRCDQRHV
jgi:acyl-CoA reductase-like NAD-dependent aldehyde dehydrogenase